MISTTELREKEIINLADGRKLGYVEDIEVNLEKGRIDSIIVPGVGKFLGIFGKHEEHIIKWHQIKKIGVDVILVQCNKVVETNQEDEIYEEAISEEIFIKKQ
ncbi:YlmC/YmxH family sporulation protein [Lutibacter sp. B2]|nr:YlmC/YmxH family sporulation protein [Lutibacter sp. B2]